MPQILVWEWQICLELAKSAQNSALGIQNPTRIPPKCHKFGSGNDKSCQNQPRVHQIWVRDWQIPLELTPNALNSAAGPLNSSGITIKCIKICPEDPKSHENHLKLPHILFWGLQIPWELPWNALKSGLGTPNHLESPQFSQISMSGRVNACLVR